MHTYNLHKILFLDIETVSAVASFNDLSETWQNLWTDKTRYIRSEEVTAEEFYPKRAAVMAEFGKVVCISCGYFSEEDGKRQFRLRSFYGKDEKTVLTDFAQMLSHQYFQHFFLCAHNGKEFDYPYLCRRMIVNEIKIPDLLDISGSKPWEVPHIDTMQLWKFGDYKHFTSIKLLAALFNIPTPKDDIDGSMVGSVYWENDDLERIVAYCEKDTITLARVFQRMQNHPFLEDSEIVRIEQ